MLALGQSNATDTGGRQGDDEESIDAINPRLHSMRRHTTLVAAACVLALSATHGCGTKQCDERAGGSGQVDGDVLGSGFERIVAAYDVGQVDTEGITVIFAFSQSVTCCEMQDEGWDERVQNGTRLVEIGLAGTTPGTYPVSTAAEPPEGEASVAVKDKSVDGLQESSATAGTVTIESIKGGKVVGSFDVTFADGQLSGSLSTAPCADGVEP